MKMNAKWTAIGGVGFTLALLTALFFAPVSAQSTSVTVGSQIKLGDGDYLPVATGANAVLAASAAVAAGDTIKETNFGTGGINDSCLYYQPVPGAAIVKFDVRLTPCQGKAAGTLVADGDTVEKGAAPVTARVTALNVVVADLNGDGRYDLGDAVYLTTGAGALPASTGTTAWSLRLTGFGTYAAGTFVKPGDSDQTSYGANVIPFGAAFACGACGMTFFDADASATMNTGDSLYLAPVATGATVAFPKYSLRVVGGSGAFGTQVKLGDADFKPTATGANVSPLASAAVAAGDSIKETNFGTGGINDSCLYYQPVPGAAIVKFDVRLTPCQGKAAGTMVADGDTVEKGAAPVTARVTALNTVVADINGNGRYDLGDSVYLTTGAGALPASTGTTAWSLRLTGFGTYAAGTFVKPGDSDQTSYGANVIAFQAYGVGAVFACATAPCGVTYYDADASVTVNTGDSVYLAPAATGAAVLFPVYSIRLYGGSAAFGTQLKFGDADFLPKAVGANTVWAASAAVAAGDTIKETNFGTGGIADSCIYYQPVAGAAIVKFDVRLTPCQGKNAGTLVGDGDTTEKGAAPVTARVTALNVVVADLNGDGRYNMGDSVYLTTGAGALPASTGTTAWSLRLTAFGTYVAGTFVKPGDSDQTSYGANVIPFGAAFACGACGTTFFDADVSGTLNTGDNVYLAPVATGAGVAFPVYSLRLSGPAVGSVVTSGTATTTTTTPSGGVTTTTTTAAVTTTTTVAPTTTNPTTKTPGLEVVAVLGGLGAALAVVARRKL